MTLHELHGPKYRYGLTRSLEHEVGLLAELHTARLESLAARLREVCADPARLARLRSHLLNDNPLKPFLRAIS